jgi:hypothetical protein
MQEDADCLQLPPRISYRPMASQMQSATQLGYGRFTVDQRIESVELLYAPLV